ncbi:MAG: glycosyltransferase [Gemmatimonadota bacterium]
MRALDVEEVRARAAGLRGDSRAAMLSAVPPPYGGVTVNVDRLLSRFHAEGLPVRLYEQTGKRDDERHIVPLSRSPLATLKLLATLSESVLHLHTNHVRAIMAVTALLRLRGRGYIVSFQSHAPMRAYNTMGPTQRALFRRTLRGALGVVAVGREIRAWVLEMGVPEGRVLWVPGFLLPSRRELAPGAVPPHVAAFVAGRSPVIGSHGAFGYLVEGIHIYSFDVLAQAIARWARRWPQAAFYSLVSHTYDEDHRHEILQMRRELGLEDRWMLVEEPFPAAALFRQTDIFLRPTTTDGDSVSVRECLHLGVSVVASDAVVRPEGVVIFRDRDVDDLEAKVVALWERGEGKLAAPLPQEDFAGPLVDLYRAIQRGLDDRGSP